MKASHPSSVKTWAEGLLTQLEQSDNPRPKEQLELLRRQIADLNTKSQRSKANADEETFEVVRSHEQLVVAAATVNKADVVVISLTTTSIKHREGEIVGVSLATLDGAFYIPIAHRFPETGKLLPDQLTPLAVAETLKLEHLPLIGHDVKFELHWLRAHADIKCTFHWDTMVAAALLRSDKSDDLKDVAMRVLDAPDWRLPKPDMERIANLSVDVAGRYCTTDCRMILKLYEEQRQCQALNKSLLNEVEMPLIEVTAELEKVGYAVDVNFFTNLRKTLEEKVATKEQEIQAIAGAQFNPSSPKQVCGLLYDQLGLPILERTATNQPSTKGDVLNRLHDQHEVVGQILEHRKSNKLLSTYGSLGEKVDPDGRLRVPFNQLGAETGRFSSSSLIQTMPKSDDHGIRQGFVAPPGSKIVAADFSQQELRILASVSRDENMMRAINEGVDLHSLAAVNVFGLDCTAEEVGTKFPEKRSQVKAVQFGIVYGKSSTSLAKDLSIKRSEADDLLDNYFTQFPNVKNMIDEAHQSVTRDGFIDDIFGRRRYIPDATLARPKKQYNRMTDREKDIVGRISAARRAAQNFVIQAAGATITKLAMLRCHQAIQNCYPQIKMILTLHDELQFEVPEEQVDAFAGELPELMCKLCLERFGISIPLEVEVKVGPSWGELSPWEETTNVSK